jgi:hypothetical protein
VVVGASSTVQTTPSVKVEAQIRRVRVDRVAVPIYVVIAMWGVVEFVAGGGEDAWVVRSNKIRLECVPR